MLKTLSAALLAASVLAAPAFAATSGQSTPTANKAAAKHAVLTAHAGMDRHHRHHRHHHRMSARGMHHVPKLAIKHTAVKRG
jgi:Ni/Co efflux regulator RcnB